MESGQVLAMLDRLAEHRRGSAARQLGKPRSSPVERVGDLELPSFRGYNVNAPAFTPAARVPDPLRLIRGHEHAYATLALLRELAGSGLAIAGHWGSDVPAVWTSHEALVLDYEHALVRPDPVTGAWVLTSTHLPWVGLRTNEGDGGAGHRVPRPARRPGDRGGPWPRLHDRV